MVTIPLLGCAPPAPYVPDDYAIVNRFALDCPVQVEVGTGQTGYEPLTDGDEVIIVSGSRSGFYVPVAGQVSGTGTAVVVRTELRDGDRPASVEPSTWATVLADYEPCRGGTFSGQRAYLSTDSSPLELCALDGAPLRLSIAVTDLEDPSSAATGEVEVVAVADDWLRERCAAE
jgi:hypothetical protein